ncbi:MAG: AAC(3) family N-acetyltransferase [Clostridia bacterium]|nr:AAC(3) family N-acetyltransferase [Clostridia bacterium]
MSITKEQMVRDFRLCGICEGDLILLHSSLAAIGHVEGGADAVVDALLEVLGPRGTLAVSSMDGSKPFDAATSPVVVGIINETVRTRPNAIRSLRPSHSIAAIGRLASYLTAGHDTAETNCGHGTPYEKLCELGGKIVLLGVDMNRNTTLHTLEDFVDAPYLEDHTFAAPTYMKDYEGKTMTVKRYPPGHRDFLSFTKDLRRADAMTEGRVGNAVVKVIDVPKMFEIGLALLQDNVNYFLCDNKRCVDCKYHNGGAVKNV